MTRLHLFEFEDLKWFPSFLRDYMTDYLQFVSNKFDIYKPAVPIIEEGLQFSTTNTIIDLASGGGGGLLKINEHLLENNSEINIILTDYFPNIKAFEYTAGLSSNIQFIDTSIDALHVPESLNGLRTMFLSFHHFKPKDAQQILQNALNSKSAIAIFEPQERKFKSILFMLFSPITTLLMTPFIKPFKLGRLLFTYLIPILPIVILWDGIVSVLRTYSVKEMNVMITKLDNYDKYIWKVGKVKSGPGNLQYILGYQKTNII